MSFSIFGSRFGKLVFLFLFLNAQILQAEIASPDEVKAAEQEQKPSVTSQAPTPEPFAFADFTWLNGNSRQKTSVLDSKYFTGTFLADLNFIANFNKPKDHSLVGSTSAIRSNEFQVEHLGLGGDFHFEHARGRVMLQYGAYASSSPRNDGSVARGTGDMYNSYRYISEAYGGYHWDALSGVNLDIGLFMSYVGLFSYYNAENWAYQSSYTSANTPWYFNGARLQVFLSEKMKYEIWMINGWQSYGMFNESPGFGFQFAYRPTGDLSIVSNAYEGQDTFNNAGRIRIHSDNSVQYKYIDRPRNLLSKAAFSVTLDLGCENGGGVKCSGGDATNPSQYFLSGMVYNRLWFDHDHFAMTLGGGFLNNAGRYLVLTPPIQGQNATTTANYFSQNPGDAFHAWDYTATFDYMPDQFMTYRAEFNHRQADVPYFAGPGGITSDDGLNNHVTPGFIPDLVKSEDRINLALLVRF